MKKQATTATDTSREYDNIRKARLAEAYKNKKEKESEETEDKQTQNSQESDEKSEKSEEKLDNKENNAYINDNSSEEQVESEEKESDDSQESEELSKEEQILRDQFNGNPKEAVKAWSNGNSEYMKLRNKFKEQKQTLDYFNQLLENNPQLQEQVKRANEPNSEVQSLNEGNNMESTNDKPVQTSQKSKLNSEKLFNVEENDLADAGYIDPSQKDVMDSSQWNNQVRQAKLRYMEDNLPDIIANQAAQKTQQRIDDYEKQKRRKAQEQKNSELIEDRYTEGVNKVVEKYGLDFAGNKEHEAMLDDIDELVVNIRDPKNPNVIHPNAVEIATQQVMSSRGMNMSQQQETEQQRKEAENKANNMFNKNKFNANKKTERKNNDQPQTIAEKLSMQHRKDYQETMKKRKQTGRIKGDTSS